MREPWCHMYHCHNEDGTWSIDYDEVHASICGLGDGLLVFAPMHYSYALNSKEWHYYILPRGLATFVALSLLIALARLVLEAHYVLSGGFFI